MLSRFHVFSALAATIALAVTAAATNTQPDIDVLYIERTPRIAFDPGDTTYGTGLPSAGQAMTYLAHVKNWGVAPMTVPFEWWFDGALAGSGQVTIPAGAEVKVPFAWTWEAADHTLEFRADPAGTLTEISRLNNSVAIRTNALLVGLWVEQSLYNYFHENQYLLHDGSNGFEDWGRRMVRRWNEQFSKASFPVCPNGVLDRLSLDEVTLVPDGALPLAGGLAGNNPDSRDRTVDVMWGYPYNAADIQPGGFFQFQWSGPFYIDFGSIHEMDHARFCIDLYGLDCSQASSPPLNVQLTDDGGNMIAGTSYMPYIAWNELYYNKWRDIMGAGPNTFDAYTAACWNWKAHKRGRGNMNSPPDIGVFMNDLPDFNHVQFIDQNGVEIPNAEVDVYQATGRSEWYGKVFDNTPEITLATDATGNILLGRNPFGGSGITHTYGYSNADIIFKLRANNQLYFMFQEVTDFNIEYWRNLGPSQHVHGYYTHQIDLRDNGITIPNDAWRGNYFNGTAFDSYAASRTDSAIDFTWTGRPIGGVGTGNYSVYWLGNQAFTEGWKQFTITADGGIRLYIDGRLVFDQWTNTSLSSWSPVIYTMASSPFVNPGLSVPYNDRHRVEVRYNHGTGTARVYVAWQDASVPPDVPFGFWRADYFSTTSLTGYMLSRNEDVIDFDYAGGSPDPTLGGDNFSSRWTGDWPFQPGTYRFTCTTDDGMRAWVDGVQRLNKWFDQGATTYTFDVALSAGTHRVQVEHYEGGGVAKAQFSWQLLSLSYDGSVNLGQWAASPLGVVLHLTVGSQAFSLKLDGQSHFLVPGSISPGTYDVKLQGPPWLSHTLHGVTFPLAAPMQFNLVNGDVNGNNSVGLDDLSAVLANFGKPSSPADLDGIDGVNLKDLSIVLRNFGQAGD